MLVRRITSDQYLLLRTIRLAALKDAPYAFGSTYAGNIDRPDEDWQKMCADRATGNDACGFFAYDAEGNAIGMVAGYREENHVSLVSMWVAPEARGTGAATALVEAVCDWAKAIPVDRVVLDVTPRNDRALRLYKRCGFHEHANHATLTYAEPEDITLERVLA